MITFLQTKKGIRYQSYNQKTTFTPKPIKQIILQIIVKDGEFTYCYDSSVKDKVDGGFVDEYYPSVEEVLEAAIKLLWNVYDAKEIAKTLRAGIPAMDYADDQKERAPWNSKVLFVSFNKLVQSAIDISQSPFFPRFNKTQEKEKNGNNEHDDSEHKQKSSDERVFIRITMSTFDE